uniref:Thioredoxin n=1 Tax=Geoglobus ahangari TaxID=113653 RepID=A0A7C3UI25_9EURY
MDDLEMIRQKKIKELLEKVKRMDKPLKADETNFNKILSQYENVVVDFWAEWCMPCRMISPVIEELAKEYSGKVVFAKLNTDENQSIAARYNISAIPTLIFFKNGKPVDILIGAFPKSEIKRWIEKNL